ncbi:ligase-associated DNA damage response endonuclease PdeM [Luteolibacter sp. SL250]|uniref:ligase-associated DNA damage response endonuclease PdeM n=1 Tax=Luteolibacter sp. SL250 TaxID=2995170 RepID=UPI0022713C5D|nr:ligase-associated DNA damage response endonuclease PdeM [Luteolibacter sp. SL250]WAC18702.1 ligase-associated DNA damage response endonuclease PdeM [Luteolibacter sp. SL250]
MYLTPEIQLLPEGVAFLPRTSSLVIADIHLGKSATFRARGLPVPEGDTEQDLMRIRNLVHETHARRLIIAGDLFHAPAGVTADLAERLDDFLRTLGIPLALVRGNHDAKLKHLPAGLTYTSHLDEGNFRIIHDPEDASPDHLNIAGHWHPVARIPDGRRTSLRLPCFLFRGRTLVLPSFGSFTGGSIVHPELGDRIFIPLRGQVIELPDTLR